MMVFKEVREEDNYTKMIAKLFWAGWKMKMWATPSGGTKISEYSNFLDRCELNGGI